MLNRSRAHEPQPLGISSDLESEWGPLLGFQRISEADQRLFWRLRAAILARRPRVKAGRKPKRFSC